jgi:DNA-binding beta-propeller fold protein YncE
VAVDASGNVFVADTGNDRIQKFDDGGTFVSAWGTPSPGGLAVDASGNVFVADELDDRIQKFDNSGAFITAWGVPQSFAGSCCPARSGVAVDASGNVFVAGDSGILKFACS